jgi:ribonuclease P protein component
MALPRHYRLKQRKEFSKVYRLGLRCSSSHLILRALRLNVSTTDGFPHSQVGVSVSQKVSKKAVVRNRIKRQIQSAMLALMSRVPPGWHLVIVVRPDAIRCEYSQFLQELEQLLIKAGIINGH